MANVALHLVRERCECTVAEQIPGLSRRCRDDNRVKGTIRLAVCIVQQPLLTLANQAINARLRLDVCSGGKPAGDGGHPGNADVAGLLRERLPLPGGGLVTKPPGPRPETAFGIAVQEGGERRIPDRKVLRPDVHGATRNTLCGHATARAAAFLEDRHFMVLLLKQKCCTQAGHA